MTQRMAMDEILADFLAETHEMLEALGGEIVAWENEPENRDRLDTIFRFVHTVKGNAALFDFDRLQSLGHAAEDALADVRAGRRRSDPNLVTAVLAIIDKISSIVDEIENTGKISEGDDSQLIAALQQSSDNNQAEQRSELNDYSALPGQQTHTRSSIRLPVELLDRMMNGVSNIVLARNEFAVHLRETNTATSAGSPFHQLSASIAEVSEAMTRSRMHPIDGLFTALPRLVRYLSSQLGKQVSLRIDAGKVELDREMIEAIRHPLVHIIRNAVDHGIELPADRVMAGKPATGLLEISARQSGNQILLHISDDGKGINPDALAEKAISAGLITPAAAAEMSPHEKFNLACLPGLSTAGAVTSISGRGVGMDVVRANLERIGGTVDLDSAEGSGTRITLRIPLTLTITPILMIATGEQHFAVPRTYIEEVVCSRTEGVEIVRMGNARMVKHREQHIPCLSLAKLLNLPDIDHTLEETLLIMRPSAGDLMALSVERLVEHMELAVRPVSPLIMSTGLYAGAAMTDEGSPILLLDVAGLARLGGLKLDRLNQVRNSDEDKDKVADIPAPDALIFYGLDGHRRGLILSDIKHIDEVEHSAILNSLAYKRVVIGDMILPLAGVSGAVDIDGRVRIAQLTDGNSTIAYALGKIINIQGLTGTIVPEPQEGKIAGVTLVDGEPVEVVNTQWLFAKLAGAKNTDTRPSCRLPIDSKWSEDFLRPIIETAGYRVARDDEQADIALTMDNSPNENLHAASIIYINTDSFSRQNLPDHNTKFDREELLGALIAARLGGR